MVRAIRLSIEAVDRRLEQAAATLGANRLWAFATITLPLIAPGIFAGAILAFARAMGEFGATIPNPPTRAAILDLWSTTRMQCAKRWPARVSNRCLARFRAQRSGPGTFGRKHTGPRCGPDRHHAASHWLTSVLQCRYKLYAPDPLSLVDGD
jgi:hypothetical protein